MVVLSPVLRFKKEGIYLLTVNNVTKSFKIGGTIINPRRFTAVNGVSLNIPDEAVVCVVGESGCGKTTLGKMVSGLVSPTSGNIIADGILLFQAKKRDRDKAALKVQMVHQDPFAALNPVHSIREELGMPLTHHRIVPRSQVDDEIERLLRLTGLDPQSVMDKYPHELSGGQRQRAVIARALTVRPRYLVADEAVSMVDVSSRLIILDLLRDICRKEHIGMLFITHDFGVARYIAYEGSVMVMYMGKVVEYGPTEEVIHNPVHPYTRVLLSSIPPLQAGIGFMPDKVLPLSFELPKPNEVANGCAFRPRCPLAISSCSTKSPDLTSAVSNGKHLAACHLL